MADKLYQDEAWLKEQYLDKKLSTTQISSKCGCCTSTVSLWLRRFGIPRRPINITNALSKMNRNAFELLSDKEWLYNEYIIKEKSVYQIADEISAGTTTIYRRLAEYGIEARELNNAFQIASFPKETRDKLNDTKWLYHQYVELGKSTIQISECLNVSDATISFRLKRGGISIRSGHPCCGEKSPNWRGGKSFEPYCPKFNEAFKERIRLKFDRKCFICGTNENSRRLDVHHIDYNKNSICNGKEWTFVPLCHHCHSKMLGSRWHWFNLLICYWSNNPEINFNPF